MRGQELGVEQAVTAEPQPRGEMDECDLARVGHPAEHALAEKRRAERDAVEPARQLAVEPAFYAVGRATGEEAAIEPQNLLADPGIRSLLVGFGAAAHHHLESGV